jgi:hypothetical protein
MAAVSLPTQAEEVCEDVWGLCEGSIPCVVDRVCIDVDNLVASIICSIDNSCDDDSEPTVPVSVATRLQAALSENGGILFGRSDSALLGDFICWNAEGDGGTKQMSCKPTGELRGASPDGETYE